MFEFMKILTLRASYQAQASGILPEYLGSTVRGILGHCIREFACSRPGQKCFLCKEKGNCPYVRYFSNTGGKAGAVNPYVIYVHTNGKTQWEAGDICTFDLTLFGNAADEAGIYLDALQAAEKKGWGAARLPFRLLYLTEPEQNKLIYAGGRLWLRNLSPHLLQVQERMSGSVLLTFHTPMRIVSGKELFEELPFEMLIQFLSRRFSLMAEAFTNHRLVWELDKMLQAAGEIRAVAQDWRSVPFVRYSINQADNRLELPARLGWVIYEGNLTRFTSLLEAGRYLHVGKGSTIGFGHYDITYDR